jgi:hypothetical protein
LASQTPTFSRPVPADDDVTEPKNQYRSPFQSTIPGRQAAPVSNKSGQQRDHRKLSHLMRVRRIQAAGSPSLSDTQSHCGQPDKTQLFFLGRPAQSIAPAQLLTPFWRRQLLKRTSGGALWSGADGPRAGAGRSAAWCEAAVLSAQGRTVRGLGPDGPRPGARLGLLPDGRTVRALGRTVRAYAGTAGDRRRRLDLAPGRDPVGE